MPDPEEIQAAVRERYGTWAQGGTPCCPSPAGGDTSCGCGGSSESLGYDPVELAALPVGADLGLGCGNPLAFAEIEPGQTVLDLGSGAGIDCLLAAKRVGPTGHVIGVDMTPEMVEKARENASRGGFHNVEFREGTIEALPVNDESVDAVISNCMINLVPDKAAAFREIFRVLKRGGRLDVSDIVLVGELPVGMEEDVDSYVACLSGAVQKWEYMMYLRNAGYAWAGIQSETPYGEENSPFVSIHVSALKGDCAPGGSC